ncbi:hypothetical protein EJ08DRAFT_337087 [Tothia fuscella]|uniref:UDP-galactose transporter n=1 Tax=Tothia fuscella TaxID=1048955 RepID=A0A9P4U303_9PEZI|nr:hypothetical protein EJ08DRAFT_337087 [Tothia fuscella]
MSLWTLPIIGKLNAAYAAALALIVIQVSIGILYKAAQSGGNYAFSASSSVTISEFLKLLLSTYFFYREWLQRRQNSTHQTLSVEEMRRDSMEEKGLCEDGSEETSEGSKRSESAVDARYWTLSNPRSDVGSFVQACRDELPTEIRYGFAQLALFYVLINNTVFLLYRLADPGTIQLIKSGTTLITALVMIFALKTNIVRGQWLAIILQVCGIVTTQYRPGGAAYPLSTYLILLFQTTISAISSVYNQNLCKSVDKSLHVMNMTLYGSGMCLNLMLHFVIRLIEWDEPGFFTGYGSWGACMVILSNVFIGLAMTAVYKYADAIIKCFATAISTGVLLYVSPILFNVTLSFLVLPGTLVVFIAAWLYAEATPPRSSSKIPDSPVRRQQRRSLLMGFLSEYSAQGRYRRAGLSLATCLTVFIIACLNSANSNKSSGNTDKAPPASGDHGGDLITIDSPFKNSLAFVRWNSHIAERIPIIKSSYSPFFYTMHISMPSLSNALAEVTQNITWDTWEDAFTIYHSVRDTMSQLLEDPNTQDIDGIMYFHFDAWVEPLQFADMDRNKIWFLDGPEPKFECMKTVDRYGNWWGWGANHHELALQGVRIASHMQKSKYIIDPDEFCIGWSDIYFIPRRYFRDYIALSDILYAVPVFHELAIPTIIHIIDKTYQSHPTRSIIEPLGDCWGSCCATNPLAEDIMWRRCGHKMDFLNENVTKVHFERLAANSLILGKQVGNMGV